MPSEDDRPGPAVNLVQLGIAKRIVRPVLERITSRGDKATVLRYHTTAPNFGNCLEANVPEASEAANQQRARTTQQGDQMPYTSRHPVPKRGFCAEARRGSPQ
jgi:hypothetical protein